MGRNRELLRREGELRDTLQQLRAAVALFLSDTGAYPSLLSDIMRPASDAPQWGLDRQEGCAVSINATDCKGPYLTTADGSLPDNPITGGNVVGTDWFYGVTAPNVGEVHAPAGSALDGTDYWTW